MCLITAGVSDKAAVQGLLQATVGSTGAPWEGRESLCLPFSRKCFFFPLRILNLNICF